MYLLQNANHNPRSWSSYTNIHSQEIIRPIKMNSTEEIARYNNHNSHYYSPVVARRHGKPSYDVVQVQKSPKKDKKWSFGNLFRLKKKTISDSSSEGENENKFFSSKKKRKSDKKKHANSAAGFDHVVIPPSSRYSSRSNGYKNQEDLAAILSEPTPIRTEPNNYFPASTFTRQFIPLKDSQESIDQNCVGKSVNIVGLPNVNNSLGRRKKECVKARARARRDTSNCGDSSDDDSQASAFRSEESLNKSLDGLGRKRSRAARTQRYLRRMSKDDDPRDQFPISKCNSEQDVVRLDQSKKLPKDKDKLKSHTKVERSQLEYTNSAPSCRPNLMGLCTIPPNHSSYSKYRTISSTNGSTYNHNNYSSQDLDGGYYQNLKGDKLSLSCEANIHNNEGDFGVVNGHYPLGNFVNKGVNNNSRQPPPPPPPRDPKRVLTVQNSEGRPISYSFENGRCSHSDKRPQKPHVVPETRQTFMNPNCRSTSEDHISWNPLQRISLIPRPSSATPQANRLQKLNCDKPNSYRYLADKNPRSRKPICIQSYNNNPNEKVSETSSAAPEQEYKPQNTFKFWQQKEKEHASQDYKKLSPENPKMFTAHTQVSTRVFLPNKHPVESLPSSNLTTNSSHLSELLDTVKQPPLKDVSPSNQVNCNDVVDCVERKSSNLEEALDELEAIYNSLHLGDEDLLDRAEQREIESVQKQRGANLESYPSSMSDSCFGYGNNCEANRKKRSIKRNETDRKLDDMAFRKLNKKCSNGDQQNAVTKISYLLASPVFGTSNNEEKPVPNKMNNEPDITYDDVVYRNVKHINNTLKVVDPQPPFGIPVGPIPLASSNDYLHATPEVAFSPKNNVPDVVKDDMAYRNLRKDSNKKPTVLHCNFNIDDVVNNNSKLGDTFKKKRAVRSLSENIFNLMQNELNSELNENDCSNENISDVADALQIARQILKDKEKKIINVRKAYLSDDDAKKQRLKENNNCYHNKLLVNIPNGASNSSSSSDRTSSEKEIKKEHDETTLEGFITSLSLENFENEEKGSGQNVLEKESVSEAFVQDEGSKETDNFSKSSSLSQLLSEIDSFTEQSFSSDKNLQFALDKKPLLAATKVEADPFEQVDKIDVEPILYETVANVVITPKNSNLDRNIITTEVFSDSDHDCVSVQSGEETDGKASESRVFDEISADIIELKKFVEQTRSDTSSSQRNSYVKSDDSGENEQVDKTKGEKSVGDSRDDASPIRACVFTNRVCFDINNTDKEEVEVEERSNDVKMEEQLLSNPSVFDDCMESLKAPKLVQNVKSNNQNFEDFKESPSSSTSKQSNYCDNESNIDDAKNDDDDNLSQLNTCDTKEPLKNSVFEHNSNIPKDDLAILNLEKENELIDLNEDGGDVYANKGKSNLLMEKMSGVESNRKNKENSVALPNSWDDKMLSDSWYEDTSVIALAWSCGIACTLQLPALNIIFMLGLFFAIVSLLFALIDRVFQ